jgi:hypothetical protein
MRGLTLVALDLGVDGIEKGRRGEGEKGRRGEEFILPFPSAPFFLF